MTELLIGCGNQRKKVLYRAGEADWTDLVTLDIDPNCGADIEFDLNQIEMPFFEDEKFDEIHAYHVLEHVGHQGAWRFFFAQWSEFYRILKPDGRVLGAVPPLNSKWLWADPGHTRVVSTHSFTFLDQTEYDRQIGTTSLCDYRHVWKGDFKLDFVKMADEDNEFFTLSAVKPSRISV